FKLAATNDEYTHLLLILPLSLAFIRIGWRRLHAFVAQSIIPGVTVMCVAALIAGISQLHRSWMTADLRLSIEMIALVTWWIGSFVLCFGTKVSRAMIFPLCFLFLMVPLPAIALNAIIHYLQYGSAFAARSLFAAAGVPLIQDGLLLSIPGLTVEIAKECSSI